MRRWIWLIAVTLMLGILLNVAVTWAIVLLNIGRVDIDDELHPIDTWLFAPPAAWPGMPGTADWSHGFAQSMGTGYLMVVDEEQRRITSLLQSELSYGWPLRAMATRVQFERELGAGNPAKYVGLSAMDRGWDVHGRGRQGEFLPLRPLALGFATNSLLWSLGLVGVALGARQVRRHRRRSNGLCVICGYEIGDLVVCPECGADKP